MYRIEHKVAHIPLAQYISEYRDVERFIGCCQACERYNACWACPPFDFDTDAYLSPYSHAYIIGTKVIFDPDIRADLRGNDVIIPMTYKVIEDVRREIDPKLLALERQYPGGRALYAGTCHVCPAGQCTKRQGKPCAFPHLVRPSLEALGFNIGKSTTELLGIDLRWSQDGILPEYLTLVSGYFSKTPLLSGALNL